MGTGLGVVVLAAIIAGLFVTGGPGEARRLKEDQQREAALLSTANALVCLQKAGVETPETQEQLEAAWKQHRSSAQDKCFHGDLRVDPVTEAPFTLVREEGRVTQICADFAAPRKLDGPVQYGSPNALPNLGDQREAAGTHCFAINYSAEVG
ncbi:hypothetical protein ACQKH5_11130 [Hyphomonas sp. NPDC076900]|uniref:hypothetical protein n=1 Tax=unclassified Hyphomonas TaxID=2630699 RepID=UPI003D078B95